MNEERRKSERRVPPAVVEFAVEERQQLLEKIADQAREIERLKAGQESLILVRDDYKRQAGEYRTLWSKAVVKPRPHGLVLPERDDVIRKAVGMCNRIPGSTTWNAAEYAYDEFVARLNSSPVSAGGVDERAAFEAAFPGYKAMVEDAKASRAAGKRVEQPSNMFRVWLYCRAALTASAHNHSENVLGMVSVTQHDANNYCLILSALGMDEEGDPVAEVKRLLSAPNHSEQVRRMVPDGWKLVPVEPTRAMRYSVETTRLASAVTRQSTQHEIGVQVYAAMLAAAPSAGSHGGDV